MVPGCFKLVLLIKGPKNDRFVAFRNLVSFSLTFCISLINSRLQAINGSGLTASGFWEVRAGLWGEIAAPDTHPWYR